MANFLIKEERKRKYRKGRKIHKNTSTKRKGRKEKEREEKKREEKKREKKRKEEIKENIGDEKKVKFSHLQEYLN